MKYIHSKTTTLDDAFLAELGRIVAHFQLLENTLASAVQGLLKCGQEECLILCCERNFKNLLDLVGSLAKKVLADQPEQLAELNSLLQRAQALEEKRNQYVHSIYGKTNTLAAIRSKTTAKRKHGLKRLHEATTDEYVNATAMDIATLAAELEHFLQQNDLGRGWI